MTREAKRELLKVIRPRYLKASKAEKGRMLDEFVAATGYNRKYAIHLLKNGPAKRRKHKGRAQTIYTTDVVAALVQVWQASGRLCSKRLQPFMSELLGVLERHNELVFERRIKALLCQMSPATIDRKLQRTRARQGRQRGLSTTKPGTLLKNAIPIRTFTDWNEQQPGFVEVDLVAHCGDTTAGVYINTLCLVDIHTHWCGLAALPNKGQTGTFEALKALRQHLPFPLLGLDRTMAQNSSMTNSTATVLTSTSLSLARVPIARMTRPTSNRKTGQWCARPSAMTATKAPKPSVS